MNSFRLQSRLDVLPTMDNVESYFQMLMAEMETLSLAPEGTNGTPAVKALQSVVVAIDAKIGEQILGAATDAYVASTIRHYQMRLRGVGIVRQHFIGNMNVPTTSLLHQLLVRRLGGVRMGKVESKHMVVEEKEQKENRRKAKEQLEMVHMLAPKEKKKALVLERS